MNIFLIVCGILYLVTILISIVYVLIVSIKEKEWKYGWRLILLLPIITPVMFVVSGKIYDDKVEQKNYWKDKYKKLNSMEE